MVEEKFVLIKKSLDELKVIITKLRLFSLKFKQNCCFGRGMKHNKV